MNAPGLFWSRKMLIALLGTSGTEESGFHWNIPHWILFMSRLSHLEMMQFSEGWKAFLGNQFMRAWHNILPLWKLKTPTLAPNLEWFHAENTRTFTRRQQNILISICPVLYKCIKYQLSIQWNITKIKNQKKQAAHRSHEDRRWQIQPGAHCEHSKISMVPTSGRGQVLK